MKIFCRITVEDCSVNISLMAKSEQRWRYKDFNYVTVQERAAAEDIKSATKDEILKRIEDKLQQIVDEEVRVPLSSKLEYFKAHPSKAKKEALLVLYNDIIEELQHLEPVDKNCIVEDGDDGEVD